MIAPIPTPDDTKAAMAALLRAASDYHASWGVETDHLLVGLRWWQILAPIFQPYTCPQKRAAGEVRPQVQVFGMPVVPTYLDPDLVWAESCRVMVIGDRIRGSRVPGSTSWDPATQRQSSLYKVQGSLDSMSWRPLLGSQGPQLTIRALSTSPLISLVWENNQLTFKRIA